MSPSEDPDFARWWQDQAGPNESSLQALVCAVTGRAITDQNEIRRIGRELQRLGGSAFMAGCIAEGEASGASKAGRS